MVNRFCRVLLVEFTLWLEIAFKYFPIISKYYSEELSMETET